MKLNSGTLSRRPPQSTEKAEFFNGIGRDQQNTMIKSLCCLMQLESSEIEISALLVEFTTCNELSRVGKPLLEMPFCFGACLVWLE